MRVIHKAVFILGIFTILIVQLYRVYGDQRVYKVMPEHFAFLPTNDQVQNGLSTSSISIDGKTAILECELKESDYPWPYCGVSIVVDREDPTVGIDFSNYHTIKLDIDFHNLDNDSEPRMRFYLRNYNAAYSIPDNEYTHKYNGLEYHPGVDKKGTSIPLRNLQVMTWWLVDNDISIEHSAPEMGNVNRIEFATGSSLPLGHYRMTINNIELVGSYVEGEDLFMGLLFVWVILGLLYSVFEIRRSQKLIVDAQTRQLKLKKLNRALKAQNIQFAELAHRDALTGAMNRHAVRDWLAKNYESGESARKPLSVIYIDIDHFKTINDQYGHSMGDDILREFTMMVMSVLHENHWLVRWGERSLLLFVLRLIY